MNKRESNLLDDLNLAVDSPKRYLASYFDELKNQIDLECQVYLGRDKLADEDKQKAISQQLELIQEVNSFEQKCFENVGKFELPTKEQIDGIREEKELYITLHQVQKQLFMNQGMFFLNSKRTKEYYINLKVENNPWSPSFGRLIIIEDEFMILNEKVEQMFRCDYANEQENERSYDWCNECIRFVLLFQRLEETAESQIHRIHLKLKEQEELDLCENHMITLMLNHSKIDVIGVKLIEFFNCDLTRIEPVIFSDLPNLETLHMSGNILVEPEKNLFKNIATMKELSLSTNMIAKLDPRIFSDLPNLEELDLSGNELVELDKDLFKNLSALKELSLSTNMIAKLDPRIFSDLLNLEELDLSRNELVELEKDLFKNLSALKKLYLNEIKIDKLEPEIFSKLPNLIILECRGNELVELDKDLFKNLPALKILYLDRIMKLISLKE